MCQKRGELGLGREVSERLVPLFQLHFFLRVEKKVDFSNFTSGPLALRSAIIPEIACDFFAS